MLINATQAEELRMAMVDGQRLYDLNIEGPASERKKANIYKGKITRIEPSLEAAFVDYGADRHGFLPLKEISSEYFVKEVQSGTKPNIRDVLKEGQDIVVQIDKEERGNKGAALTTFVSLAGRFIVLKPNKSRSGGVSRRIVGADRDLARKSLSAVDVPKGMSVILRTAGIDRNAEELGWDLENLMAVWQAILNVVLERPSPFLIYRESNAVVRALRDYMTNEIGEILIDDEATYREASEFVEQVMPHNLRKLKHYTDPVPLFTRFQIESQIESAFAHSVTLPSGGSIVIDHTEALVSIDINSARATKGGDIEATALNTNLEAADEISRQLRIRDLGGLIVIDFIDMGPQKNQRAVENRLREAVRQDRARVQIGKITRFGLLEMSRQRLRPSLGESSYHTCPRCSGFGTIRSVESLALAILRIVGEEARKERTVKVIAQLPVEVATYLLNEKRDWVRSVETRHDTQVILVANSALETPHYDVRRVRDDQADLPENAGVSYSLAESEQEPELPTSLQERKAAEQAAIGKIEPTSPAPKRETPPQPGFFSRLMSSLFGEDKDADKKKKKKATSTRRRKSTSGGGRGATQRDRRRGGSRQDDGRRAKKSQGKKAAGAKSPARDDAKRSDDKRGKQKSQPSGEGRKAEPRDESRRASKTRRSRGGRRRRRSDAPASDAQAQEKAQPQQKAAPEAARERAEKQKPESPRAGKETGQPKQRRSRRQDPAEATGKAADGGPPKARADAERAADAAAQAPKPDVADDKTSVKRPDEPKVKPETAPKSESRKPSEPAAEAVAEASKADAPEKRSRKKTAAKRKPKSDKAPKAESAAEKPGDAESQTEPKPPSPAKRKTRSKPESTESTESPTAPKTAPQPEDKPARKPRSKPKEAPTPNADDEPAAARGTDDKPVPKSEPKPEPKSEPQPGNGSGDKDPAAKPAGRLLPWEPTQPPAEVRSEPAPEKRDPADEKPPGND
jgi:ribonuclease E